ncbi:hypothetical protein [Derxia gummosa]|uniref:Outer membrane protein beta-barrel domain-containing protein n=1 Tax=Derxia gummosa DSM 723 TaxID=1121388 RepID=A0A8B6X3H2_9BURK|nr:hypothetical protein [Derxia gummosa]
MKRIALLSLALAGATALPASAHELGLLLDQQFTPSQDGGGTHVGFIKPHGVGLRGAYTLVNLGVAEVGITGGWHDKVSDDIASAPSAAWNRASFGYTSLGVQADWKLLVNLNAGLELRREVVTLDRAAGGSEDHDFTRPWARVGFGWSLPTPVVSPFLRFEGAYALTRDSLPANAGGSDFAKAVAPRYQVGVYGGIRF